MSSPALESFTCPLTQEVFVDPVMDPEGYTYERRAIEDWLAHNATSPLTRTPLTREQLVPNRSVREAIEEWKKSLQRVSDSSSSSSSSSAEASDLAESLSNNPRPTERYLARVQYTGALERTPLDLCCVIDVSGSMSQNVTYPSAPAAAASAHHEPCHLTQLDLVQHALKTIIHCLNEQDRLCLVVFAVEARCVFEWQWMSAAGRELALNAVESITANGGTNIWRGIECGVRCMNSRASEGLALEPRHTHMFLLTDGQSNVDPPRGLLVEVEQLLSTPATDSLVIDTFGFGYQIHSPSLDAIARYGRGCFLFIPDASFVGTVFINALASALITKATQLSVKQRMEYDQIVTMPLPANLRAGETIYAVSAWPIEEGVFSRGQPTAVAQMERTYEVSQRLIEIKQTLATIPLLQRWASLNSFQLSGARTELQEWIETTAAWCPNAPLLVDLRDQVTLALSRDDWYLRWGKHYLLSFARAHAVHQCTNFKDTSLQVYGTSDLFQTLRLQLNAIFCALPAPRHQNVDMANFNDAAAGCFHGDCLVQMYDAKAGGVYLKRMKQLQPGDEVYTNMETRTHTTVKYVVRTQTSPYVQRLEWVRVMSLHGLLITAWHPVRVEGKWQFPATIKGREIVHECNDGFLYNVVLDEHHVMCVNGVECVTLGHGFTDDPVVQHDYFGTDRVVHDIAKCSAQQGGTRYVTIRGYARNPSTGRIDQCIG